MRLAELASQNGYRKRHYYGGGKPSVASPNYLERQFTVPNPNTHWADLRQVDSFCPHDEAYSKVAYVRGLNRHG